MIEHVSEMELYIILSTIKKFEGCNQSFNHKITEGEIVVGAVIPNSSCRYAFRTLNKYYLIILLSCTGVPCPKERSSDLALHPREASTPKVNGNGVRSFFIMEYNVCIISSPPLHLPQYHVMSWPSPSPLYSS